MRNWLISLLGGVNERDFQLVFDLANKDREVMYANNTFLINQCDMRQQRINYLEDLIFTKTGFIAGGSISSIGIDEQKDYQPIHGARNWNSVKAEMRRKDQAIIKERHKDVR